MARLGRIKAKRRRQSVFDGHPAGCTVSPVPGDLEPAGDQPQGSDSSGSAGCGMIEESGGSCLSVQSSTTFGFRSAISYENILLAEGRLQRRSASDATLVSGDEVLNKLRALKKERNLSHLRLDLGATRHSACNLRSRETDDLRLSALREQPEVIPRTRKPRSAVLAANDANARSLPMSPESHTTSENKCCQVSSQMMSPAGSMPADNQPPVKPPRRRNRSITANTLRTSTSSNAVSTNSRIADKPHQTEIGGILQSCNYDPIPRSGRVEPFRCPEDNDTVLWSSTSQSSLAINQSYRPIPAPRSVNNRHNSQLSHDRGETLIGAAMSPLDDCRSPLLSSVQNVDNGFFENFTGLAQRQRSQQRSSRGHRLRQLNSTDNDNVVPQLARCSSDSTSGLGKHLQQVEDVTDRSTTRLEDIRRQIVEECSRSHLQDSGVELACEAMEQNLLSEELYAEALHTLKHPVGCDAPSSQRIKEAEDHLRQMFDPDHQFTDDWADKLTHLQPPELCLECTVISASGLAAADVNGLSDPLCVLKVNGEERRETPVCYRTLNPVWNQKFILALSDPQNDAVQFDVLDYDAEENLAQRIGKIGDIKGVRGFTRFVKDMARKSHHDFLGQVSVNVKDIPALGTESLYKLQPLGHDCSEHRSAKERGRLRVRLRLVNLRASDENCEQSEQSNSLAQRHCNLMLALVMSERAALQNVNTSTSDQPPWTEQNMSAWSRVLVDQHAALCNLDQAQLALCRWTVFAQVHCSFPVSYAFLYSNLQTVRAFLQSGAYSADDIFSLAECLVRFCEHCYESVRLHRHIFSADDNGGTHNLETMLRCLLIISEMSVQLSQQVPRASFDQLQSGVRAPNTVKLSAARQHIISALQHGNDDWYRQVYGFARKQNEESGDASRDQEARCQGLILMVNMLHADVEGALDVYDHMFKRNMNVNYFGITYLQFAEKLQNEVGPVVEELSHSLTGVEWREDSACVDSTSTQHSLDMGTSLFELYMAIQAFTSLSSQLPPDCDRAEPLPLHDCHTWFSTAVNRWMDIACYKAMRRIRKAIELDQDTQVHSYVNHSSSAVDTVAIFYQIRTFWNQMNWPDPVGSYGFVTKVLDDITRSAAYYVNQMHASLRAHGYKNNQRPFHFSQPLCLAINSVDFVHQQIGKLPAELSFDTVFTSLEAAVGTESTLKCRATLQNVIDQASEDVEQAAVALIDGAVAQVIPHIRSSVSEVRVCSHDHQLVIESVTHYLDTNLSLIYPRLTPINLRRLLECLWRQVVILLEEEAMHHRKLSSEYFSALSDLLSALVEVIHGDGKGLPLDSLHTRRYSKLNNWLTLYKNDAQHLIANYYCRKYMVQQSVESSGHGKLSLKAFFIDNVLRVEILNARGLSVADPDSCNAYVKFHIQPVSRGPDMKNAKTRVHNKTIFPLFDEIFEFSVDRSRLVDNECSLVFTVKSAGMLKQSTVLGEAVIPVSELATLTFDQSKHAHQHMLNILPSKILPELDDIYTTICDKSCSSVLAASFVRSCVKKRRGLRGLGLALPRIMTATSMMSLHNTIGL